MKDWLRRDVLKSGVALPAAAGLGIPALTPAAAAAQSGRSSETQGGAPALRERLLLDFGWRFHFGHANDAAKDFGFGSRPLGRVPEDRWIPGAKQS